jgi:hypothetical protein
MPVFHGMGVLQIALVVSATYSKYFLSKHFAAVCWSGDGGIQASIPSCPAESSERIGRDDCN